MSVLVQDAMYFRTRQMVQGSLMLSLPPPSVSCSLFHASKSCPFRSLMATPPALRAVLPRIQHCERRVLAWSLARSRIRASGRREAPRDKGAREDVLCLVPPAHKVEQARQQAQRDHGCWVLWLNIPPSETAPKHRYREKINSRPATCNPGPLETLEPGP